MSVVRIQIESNAGEVATGISQVTNQVENLSAETKVFAKTSDAAFTTATNEADAYNKEIKDATTQTAKLGNETKTVAASGNRIKELKQEIKALKNEALAAGEGTELFAQKLREAGKLTDEVNDINAALKSVAESASSNVAGALGEVTSIGISGFEGITAASSLLGVETENVEKQLLKLQSLRSLANLAKEFGGLGDKITEIKLGLSPLTNAFKEVGTNAADNIKSIADGYSNANQSLKDFGNNFKSNVSGAFKSVGSGITGFFTSFGSGVKGFFTNFSSNAKGLFTSLGSGIKSFASSGIAGIKALGAAIAANPLGILLVVIGAVVAAFVAMSDKVKPIAAIFSAIGDAIDWVGDKLKAFGQALGLVASDAEERAQKTVDNVGKEIEAIDKRYSREIKLAQAAGKDVEKLEQDKLASQIVANKKALAAYEVIKKEKGDLDKEDLEKQKELNEQLIDLQTDLQASFTKQNTEAAKKADELRKKNEEAAKKANEDRLKRLEELNAALLDLAKKSEQAILNTLSGKERLDKQREINLQELKAFEDLLKKKQEAAGKGNVLGAKEEEQLANIKFAINKQYQDDLNKLALEEAAKKAQRQIDEANAQQDAANKAIALEQKSAELRAKAAITEVEATQAPADASADELVQFELEKQKLILEIEKDTAIKSLEIQKRAIDEEFKAQETALNNELILLQGKDDAVSKARVAAIAKTKETLKQQLDDTKRIAVAETEKTVDEINNKLGKIKPKDKDIAKTIKDITDIVNSSAQILSEFVDKEIAANERATEASRKKQEQYEEELDALKDKLGEEQALKDDGFANDSDRIQRDIAAKEAEILKEKEREAALAEERKKQAKIKLAIDAALQGSAILTAGTNLFVNQSTLGPLGIAAALVSIGAMVAGFLALKSQLDAINSGAGFEKGGYTGDTGTKEVAGVVHGKEFVMTAQNTDKHFDLFQGIHTGNKDLMRRGIADLLKDTGVTLPLDIAQNIKAGKDGIKSKELNIISQGNNKGIESRLDKLEKHLSKLVIQGNEIDTALPDGSIMKKKGTHTSIVRNTKGNGNRK